MAHSNKKFVIGVLFLLVLSLLIFFFWPQKIREKTEENILPPAAVEIADNNNELVTIYKAEIITLLRLNEELVIQRDAYKKQLENVDKQSCTPVQIMMQAPPELLEYGFTNFISTGETELCGTNMVMSLKTWGPSLKTYIEEMEKELKYYKSVADPTSTAVAQ